MSPLSPPVRVGRSEPLILVDTVIRWGPCCVLSPPASAREPAIIVEYADGLTPITFRRTEPRC